MLSWLNNVSEMSYAGFVLGGMLLVCDVVIFALAHNGTHKQQRRG